MAALKISIKVELGRTKVMQDHKIQDQGQDKDCKNMTSRKLYKSYTKTVNL